MPDPIRNTPVPTSSTTAQSQSASTSESTTPASSPAVDTEQAADQAAADLDMLAAAHRRRSQPRRRRPAPGPRREPVDPHLLSPANVALRAPTERFFEAMEPPERKSFLEALAEKITSGAVEDLEGMVEIFNNMRARANERRAARGDETLPELELDHGLVRRVLEHGIEAGLEEAVHAILESALHALFGAPTRMPPERQAAGSLELPPLLERDPNDHGFHVHWTRSF